MNYTREQNTQTHRRIPIRTCTTEFLCNYACARATLKGAFSHLAYSQEWSSLLSGDTIFEHSRASIISFAHIRVVHCHQRLLNRF